jgi:hypothetical protein
MKRYLKKEGKVYIVTFDSEGVLDTVSCGGELLSLKNRVVQQVLNNANKILAGFTAPKGFEWAPKP